MVVQGKGGEGQTDTGTTIIDKVPQASSTLSSWACYACWLVKDLQIIEEGAVSYSPPPKPEPSTTSRTGQGANLRNSRRCTGNQGKYGIGRQSVVRFVEFLWTDDRWQLALLAVDGWLNKNGRRGGNRCGESVCAGKLHWSALELHWRARNPGESRRGERGVPEPYFWGREKKYHK